MWDIFEKVRALFAPKGDSFCSEMSIPSYLHTGNRKIDNIFQDDELIYRRFNTSGKIEDWIKEQQEGKTQKLSAAVFEVKSDSTNREKYSRKPEDVLYTVNESDDRGRYNHYGIVQFAVGDFNKLSVEPKKPVRFNGVDLNVELRLEHTPTRCMYPHTEILVDKIGIEDPLPPSAEKIIRAAVRDALFKISKVYRYPISPDEIKGQ